MLTYPFFKDGLPRPLTASDYAEVRGIGERADVYELSSLVRQGAVKRTEDRGTVVFMPRMAEPICGAAPARGVTA